MLRSHGRFPYSAITNRPSFTWPEGRRLAIHVSLNLEHFAYGEGLGISYSPGLPHPNTYNWGWREYGNRVGVWRLLELFDEFKLPVSLLLNSEVYDHCPEVVAAFRARGDEVVGHGRTNSEHQNDFDEAGEKKLIDDVTSAIKRHEGKPPAGWLSPGVNPSNVTPDLLEEAGYRYILDWPIDDQPVWIRTRKGRLLSVPYPQEVNDIPDDRPASRHCRGFCRRDHCKFRRDATPVPATVVGLRDCPARLHHGAAIPDPGAQASIRASAEGRRRRLVRHHRCNRRSLHRHGPVELRAPRNGAKSALRASARS